MHEDRTFPRFLPRVNKTVKITFGNPDGISEEVKLAVEAWKEGSGPKPAPDAKSGVDPEAGMRIALCEIVQRSIERLGDEVTGQGNDTVV